MNNTLHNKNLKDSYLILISIDALNAKDYESIKKMSYFSELMQNGTTATKAVGVYPSLTYPSHVSIITGTYPYKHGIYDNKPCNPQQPNVPWFFYNKDIKVKTLYQLAREKGLITSSFFWPVTAGAKINYNCPPIWPTYKKESQTLLSLKYGTPLFLIEINKKFGWLRDGLKYPNLDNFTAVSAAYTLKKYKPNLLMVAFSELDHERHKYGFYSKQALKSLYSTNERVGLVMQAAKDAGIFDKTTFVILGDHGFLDFTKNISLNNVFKSNDLLKLNNEAQVTECKAYAHSAGGSAQIYLYDNNKSLEDKVFNILNKLKEQEIYGIEAIFNKQQAKEKGVVGDFSFIVEAKKGYHFVASALKPLIEEVKLTAKEFATHGYDPLKNDYYTMTIFSGYKFISNEIINKINLIDVAPTLASILNSKLPEADGRILTEILV